MVMTRLDYSVKLVCAKNFTGPACSVAKICLGRLILVGNMVIHLKSGWDKSANECPAQKRGKFCVSQDGG